VVETWRAPKWKWSIDRKRKNIVLTYLSLCLSYASLERDKYVKAIFPLFIRVNHLLGGLTYSDLVYIEHLIRILTSKLVSSVLSLCWIDPNSVFNCNGFESIWGLITLHVLLLVEHITSTNRITFFNERHSVRFALKPTPSIGTRVKFL